MKKFILLLIAFCACAIYASAEVQFEHVDNVKGTNITLVDDNASQNLSVTDAVFVNNGKTYQAKDIRCDIENGKATIKLKFKKCTVFKDCKVILTINGKKETVNIIHR